MSNFSLFMMQEVFASATLQSFCIKICNKSLTWKTESSYLQGSSNGMEEGTI